VLTIAHR